MALSVNHPEAGKLAHQLAERMGETVEEAVVTALRERLERTPARKQGKRQSSELLAIGRQCAALPDYDLRSAEDIVGYDENGVPR
jgi:antitoxin VapB